MAGLYRAEQSVLDIVQDLIGQHHPDLALVSDEIAVVFREKAGKAGGKAVLGRPKKASPLIGVLGDTEYKFVLELAQDEWLNLTSRQQRALLDHLLCACRVEEDPQSGNMKCYVAPADVSFYWDELDRWGDWRPRPEGEGPDGPSPIEEIFGTKPEEEDGD